VESAIARLIRAELERREIVALELPSPVSPIARRAAELLSLGADRVTVQQAARAVGLSLRALERRFLAETGLPIARWRRQARLHQALRRLAAGETVKAAARTAGYASASAFVAAFRDAFGVTPGRYFQ
jgi:AraC-like DNA-binding protein